MLRSRALGGRVFSLSRFSISPCPSQSRVDNAQRSGAGHDGQPVSVRAGCPVSLALLLQRHDGYNGSCWLWHVHSTLSPAPPFSSPRLARQPRSFLALCLSETDAAAVAASTLPLFHTDSEPASPAPSAPVGQPLCLVLPDWRCSSRRNCTVPGHLHVDPPWPRQTRIPPGPQARQQARPPPAPPSAAVCPDPFPSLLRPLKLREFVVALARYAGALCNARFAGLVLAHTLTSRRQAG